MTSPLKQLAGNYAPKEETPPTPTVSVEDLIAAEADIDEGLYVGGLAVTALEQYQTAVNEAEAHTATADRYIQVIAHGLEHGQFSPHLLANAHGMLDDLRYLGVDSKLVSTGLESYMGDNMKVGYSDGLEDFKGVVKRMASVIAETTKGLASMITKSSTFESTANGLTTKADALLADAAKLQYGQSTDVNTKGLKSINVNTGPVSNLTSQIDSDLKGRTYYQTTYIKGLVSYQQDLLAAALAFPSNPTDEDGYANGILAVKHPAAKVPSAQLSGKSMLAQNTISAPKAISKTGMDGLTELLSELSVNHGIETVLSSGSSNVSLTPADLEKILKAVKQYATILKAYTGVTAGLKTQMEKTPSIKNDGASPAMVKLAERTIKTARASASSDPVYTAVAQGHELARISNDLLKLAERTIKLAPKQPTAE